MATLKVYKNEITQEFKLLHHTRRRERKSYFMKPIPGVKNPIIRINIIKPQLWEIVIQSVYRRVHICRFATINVVIYHMPFFI